MAIHYHCRHCKVEIGSLPFESAQAVLNLVSKLDETEKGEQFLKFGEDGEATVSCICEQCEQSLQQFPDYYTLNKWLH